MTLQRKAGHLLLPYNVTKAELLFITSRESPGLLLLAAEPVGTRTPPYRLQEASEALEAKASNR